MCSWGPDGPPQEAYGRVTDAERFRGLHRAGRDVLDELDARYLVDRERFLDHDRPTVPEAAERLVPSAAGASPLALTYTESPGLVVAFGHDQRAHIPRCACDACAETLDECLEQLQRLIAPVVAGTFGETLTVSGGTWQHRFWSLTPGGLRSEGSSPVDDEQAEALLARLPDGRTSWTPWQPRPGATAGSAAGGASVPPR